MITLGVLGGLVVAAALTAALLARPLRVDLALTYRRFAWIPLAALVVEAALWKPVLTRWSYFAVVPPLLTCVASLFLAVVGATLAATCRERNQPTARVVRATFVAAIPGILLLGYLVSALARAMLLGLRR